MSLKPAWSPRVWLLPVGLSIAAIALALGAFVVEIPDRHWWATTLQLIGAIVTLLGFWNAYDRARYGRTLGEQLRVRASQFRGWLRRTWARLRGKPLSQNVYPSSAGSTSGTFGFKTMASGFVGVDPNAPLELQVERLVALANQLSKDVDTLQSDIRRLDQRIDHASANATKGLEDAIAQIRGEIEQLTARLDRYQVLDLRWAIRGIAITVVGLVLSY